MTRLIAPTLTALLVVALVASTAVAPVAADHNESNSVSDALDPGDDGIIATIRGAIDGTIAKAFYTISGPDDSAEQNRDDAIMKFNEHSDAFVTYANNRSIHEGEVVQVDCVIGGETATGYIVSDYNSTSDEYDSAEAVQSTDRAVDHTITLEKAACDNAAAELERFYDDFASQDKDVTKRYMAEMAAKYGGNVDEPFTGR